MGNLNTENNENGTFKTWESEHRRGKIFGGFLVVIVGALFLSREMGVLIPHWVFTWQMLLIAIGLVSAVKHGFRRAGWIFILLIGGAFLIRDIMPELIVSNYIWPVVIICVGIFIMLKPRKKYSEHHWKKWHRHDHRFHRERWEKDYSSGDTQQSSEEYINSDSVFGGVKRNIISKNFKGGEINCVFGGAEINLSQADINGRVILEANIVFGGLKLIIPPHWAIQSELSTVLGSVEDKRPLQKDVVMDSNKVIVLRGATVCGGIEIRSY